MRYLGAWPYGVASRSGTCGPNIGRRSRHTGMDDFPRWQFDDEERKKRTKEEVSHLKEIAGPDLVRMIAQKRPPVLPRRARRAHTPHVFLDRSFADVDIQFQ